ncbi:mitochondrial 50S ribosomal protein L5 [Multifurca ochricompacta]|uniref:Mitochondrial 50S ribosomal protein L5 n=1 Tax=Multifurca ochricompacta TaxID=376703 RepID=A0AAD4QJR5_9AGAM|nr:mitochondrial 50S ribosomal protein L5 [Multifurca ochricompacta]
MSAGTIRAAVTAGRSLRPIRKTRKLVHDERGLPIPHVDIVVRDTHLSRLDEHYHNTLADNLMYMTYKHESGSRPPPRDIHPYVKLRHNPSVGGSQLGRKPSPPTTSENVIRLERIQLHTMTKEALVSRHNLLGPIMAFRALSGETEQGGGRRGSTGVQVVRGVKSVGGWVRPGLPLGAKVDLRGTKMYEFLGTLTEFVLPRLREFSGLPLPPASANLQTPSGVSGVAMGFFPQIEVNIDAYPKMYGMHIHFITNARGVGAQDRARQLLSGFQIPFARR